jgi:hypothetical protein
MAKFGPGGYKRSDGKWCKPPNWKKPDLKAIIEQQLAAAQQRDRQVPLIKPDDTSMFETSDHSADA